MNWIVSIIIGGVIGWLASIIMKTNAQMGLIANVLVGVVGSLLGVWIAGALGIGPRAGESAGGLGIVNFIIGLLGAVLLIFILRAVGVLKKA